MSKSTNVIFYYFYFREGMTCAHDFNRQTDPHIDTETDTPMAIGEILQICIQMKTAYQFQLKVARQPLSPRGDVKAYLRQTMRPTRTSNVNALIGQQRHHVV